MVSVEKKVASLEQVLKETLIIQQKSEIGLISLQDEMKEFKNEMKEFKNEINKKWGDLANKMGTVIEDIIAPNIPELAKNHFNCEIIDRYLIRPYVTNSKDKTIRREFDVVVSCETYVFLTSSKSTVNQQVIDEFKLFINSGEFFDYFSEYSSKKLIPILASPSIPENLINYMTKHKIIGLIMSGSTMIPVNISELKDKF